MRVERCAQHGDAAAMQALAHCDGHNDGHSDGHSAVMPDVFESTPSPITFAVLNHGGALYECLNSMLHATELWGFSLS